MESSDFFFREEGFVWVNSWKGIVHHDREGMQTGWWDGQLHWLCSQDAERGINADSHQISRSLPCFFLSLDTQPTLMVIPSLLYHLWNTPSMHPELRFLDNPKIWSNWQWGLIIATLTFVNWCPKYVFMTLSLSSKGSLSPHNVIPHIQSSFRSPRVLAVLIMFQSPKSILRLYAIS